MRRKFSGSSLPASTPSLPRCSRPGWAPATLAHDEGTPLSQPCWGLQVLIGADTWVRGRCSNRDWGSRKGREFGESLPPETLSALEVTDLGGLVRGIDLTDGPI